MLQLLLPVCLHPGSILHFVFLSDYAHRQGCADTKEHEERPFPAEGFEGDGEYELVEQFAICEKVECATDKHSIWRDKIQKRRIRAGIWKGRISLPRRLRFDPPCHINPLLHLILLWPS